MSLMMRGLANSEFMDEVSQGVEHLGKLPILNLWSDGDWRQMPQWSARFEQLFPNYRTIIVPDAKHFPQEDNPDEIVAAIRDWWPC